jgi:hypothetical protein
MLQVALQWAVNGQTVMVMVMMMIIVKFVCCSYAESAVTRLTVETALCRFY